MYKIKMEDYVPEPRPATADRIVAAHYYPAWKKGAAGLHQGFDDLHDFPERTPLMGYYDEEDPKVCDFEIKWALEHGINCFIYCWYRKKENEGKPVTREAIRCGHGIHEALFRARYGNQMKFAIMYENFPRWGQTSPEDLLENLLPFWTETYFSRENYLKIDNKPVLFVCSKVKLDKCFSSPEEERETFDRCREYLRQRGFDGLSIGVCNWENEIRPELYEDCDVRGYDFHFRYDSGYQPKENFPSDEEIIEGQVTHWKKRLPLSPENQIPLVSCFQDPTPRTTQPWMDMGFRFDQSKIYYLSPDGFRRAIREMKQVCDALPENAWGRKIFMIDNWNEWDEGHYVAPSHEFGFRYLQAIREELTLRDNLPDYRTPQDMGIFDLNHSWEVSEDTFQGKK